MTENTQNPQDDNTATEEELQQNGAAGSLDDRIGELEAQLKEAQAEIGRAHV